MQSIYPDLVAQHGNALTLARAEDAIARTHGFPSWSAAVAKAGTPTAARAVEKNVERNIATLIRTGYMFVAGEEMEIATVLADGGTPTRFALGREVVLSFRRRHDAAVVRREDEALDAIADQLGGLSGSYDDYTPQGLTELLSAARAAVARCPLYLDGWNQIAGALLMQHEATEGLAVAEPVATALLDLLPAEGGIQACYGVLANRPFFRLTHCYLLLLHEVGRHREADALADRLYHLWPNDNMGFRFLLTRSAREAM